MSFDIAPVERLATAMQRYPGYPGWLTLPDKTVELIEAYRELVAENERLYEELEELHLRRIAIENPGIDMERVRREREQLRLPQG